MTRPWLDRVPLDQAIPIRPGRITITMSVGQWDGLLAAAYEHGCTLLELDENERPVAAYRRSTKEVTE